MKLYGLQPTSFYATIRDSRSIKLFFNDATETVCYREFDGSVVELGSNTSIISTLTQEIEELQSNIPTYSEVTVSSAELLSIGTAQKELLADPGAGKYYDIEKVIIEYNGGTTQYTLDLDYLSLTLWNSKIISAALITTTEDGVVVIKDIDNASNDDTNNVLISLNQKLNQPLMLGTYDGNNPTGGDGTLLVKMWFKVRTFGSEL